MIPMNRFVNNLFINYNSISLVFVRGKKQYKGLAPFDLTPALEVIRGQPGRVTPRKSAKLIGWEDYQHVKFRSEQGGWPREHIIFRTKMLYAENLVRMGMSNWSIEYATRLHPNVISYIRRRASGNVSHLKEGPQFGNKK